MVAEAPGPINFTMFLGLFGDRLKGYKPKSLLYHCDRLELNLSVVLHFEFSRYDIPVIASMQSSSSAAMKVASLLTGECLITRACCRCVCGQSVRSTGSPGGVWTTE